MNLVELSESSAHWRRRLTAPFLLSLYGSTLLAFVLWIAFGADSFHGLVRVLSEGLAGYFVAFSCLGAQTLVGASLLALPGWDRGLRTVGERILFGWIAGFVTTSAVLLVLAWANSLNASTVIVSALMGGAWSGWRSRESFSNAGWRRALSGGGPEPAVSQGRPGSGGAGLAIVLAIGIVSVFWAWPLLAQTFLPNSDWDSALYHLPLASRYLAGDLWNADPLFSAHSFPGAISLVYAAFMSLGMEAAIIPYNFLGALLTLLAAGCLAQRLGGKGVAGWAVLLSASAHVLWQLGVDPRVDAFLGIFVSAAVLALCIWLEDREDAAPLFLMAISINAAMGTKYTGLFIGLAIAGLAFALVVVSRLRGGSSLDRRKLTLVALLLVIPNGVWYASNAVLHADPLFPMLRGDYYESPERPGVRIPTATALDPALARLSPDSVERRRARSLEQRFESSEPANLFDLGDLLRRPEAHAVKPNHFTSPLLLLFLALPFALPRAPGPRAGAWCVYAIGVGCFAALGIQTNLLRYVLPLFPLFAAGAALVVARLPNRIWPGVVLILALALLASNHIAEVEKLESLRPSIYVRSDADRISWLTKAGYNFTTSMPLVIERINAEIAAGRMSEDDVILMVGEGKGRLLECGYLPDLSWFLQRWVVELVLADHRPGELLRALRGRGVTHILYNKSYFVWVVGNTQTPVDNIAYAMIQLERFLHEHAERVLEVGGMGLFRMDPPAVREPSAN